jgi:hypothetical protein
MTNKFCGALRTRALSGDADGVIGVSWLARIVYGFYCVVLLRGSLAECVVRSGVERAVATRNPESTDNPGYFTTGVSGRYGVR